MSSATPRAWASKLLPLTTGPIRLASLAARLASLAAVLAAAMSLALLPPAPAAAQGTDPVVAKVDGVEIRESDLAFAEEDLGQNIPPQLTGDAKRDFLVSYLADIIMVAKSPDTRKAVGTVEFQRRLNFMQNKLMMETMLQNIAKTSVSDQAMKQVYDDAIKQMSNEEEVRARHILVPTEAEAKTILADLKKGADFEKLAKEKSKDPGSGAQGGDLGYFTKEQMVPEFAEVAFKLDKGQISDLVKSQFGWHIIKVEDKRPKAPPTFDQVKDQVETFVQRKAQADYVSKLREGAKIERLDKK